MRFVSTLLVLTTLLTVGASKEDSIDPVTRLMERLPAQPCRVEPDQISRRHRDGGCAEGARCFSIQNGDKPGTISIAGSTGVGRRRACTTTSGDSAAPTWVGRRLEATSFLCPSRIAPAGGRRGVVVNLPFERTVYMNPETFSYSTAFWDYERWEKEIEWMALTA